jgi:transposase InsO family protein
VTVIFPVLIARLIADLCRFVVLSLKSRSALAAENLFLRKQLALYQERKAKRLPASIAVRWTMIALGKLFAWREALAIVKPDTYVGWHGLAFRLFWRWKSRPTGRPSLPKNIRALIRKMDRENPTWGEERIGNELLLKLNIRVSPRTVAKYLTRDRPRGVSNQRWKTFIGNHAKAVVACDFFVSVTATFRVLYVFVAMEVGSRRVLHFNVTSYPTAEWTSQQFRELLAFDHPYRFVIHDRDSIFSAGLDTAVKNMGVKVLKTPFRAPMANAYCERLIGTFRRECLDWVIPFGERHLRQILREEVVHYNRDRPHSALEPGIPEPTQAKVPAGVHRHKLPEGYRVSAKAILGGLHHEYSLEKEVA